MRNVLLISISVLVTYVQGVAGLLVGQTVGQAVSQTVGLRVIHGNADPCQFQFPELAVTTTLMIFTNDLEPGGQRSIDSEGHV